MAATDPLLPFIILLNINYYNYLLKYKNNNIYITDVSSNGASFIQEKRKMPLSIGAKLVLGNKFFLFTSKNVSINENFAKWEMLVSGKKTSLSLHFYKEEWKWKMDLTSLFPASKVAFKKILDDSGKEEDEFISTILEYSTWKKREDSIWEALVK